MWVKCIATKAYPGAPPDPLLTKGRFYIVLDESIETISSPDPYIEILVDGQAVQRPRHLFGRLLESRSFR